MTTQPEPTKRLYRSERDRMLAGVCGGVGEFFGIDATLVRVVFVLLAFASGFGVIAYVVMWLIVPTESKTGAPAQEVPRAGLEEMREGVERGTRKARDSYDRWRGGSDAQPPAGPPPPPPPPPPTGYGTQAPGAGQTPPGAGQAPQPGGVPPAPGGEPPAPSAEPGGEEPPEQPGTTDS
jgi:phage shock protein C